MSELACHRLLLYRFMIHFVSNFRLQTTMESGTLLYASCVEDFRFNDVTDDSLCHYSSSFTKTWINTRVRVDLRVDMVPFLQQFPMMFLEGYVRGGDNMIFRASVERLSFRKNPSP
jgi:hypothetical protein